MKNKYLTRLFSAACTSLPVILIILSCNRKPQPDFSYVPSENPEAGDTIAFINSSADADSYAWEFGDGGTSTIKNPEYIYEQSGIYKVKLTASNDAGEESVIQSITINEPTILGFYVYDSTGTQPLQDAEIWVYDNESDWDNFNEPLLTNTTDAEGLVVFMNVEPLVYYIWVIKEESGGFWGSGGYTEPVVQNEPNLYNVTCTWMEDQEEVSRKARKTLRKTSPGKSDW